MSSRSMHAVSLFSGAGGMDIGFKRAGYDIAWANDLDPVACETFTSNDLGDIACGSINDHLHDLKKFEGIDLVFGGPPCQGFSVAGKMDPTDKRSALVWSYVKVIEQLRPSAFVMENVKALATLSRWSAFRFELIQTLGALGYSMHLEVLKATDFNVPQKRERMFLVGVRKGSAHAFKTVIKKHQRKAQTVRKALSHLDIAGTGNNQRICNAEITLASNPIMRKSPYAGMIFNGAGRPIEVDGYALTLPASMGGNKTPIIDDVVLADTNAKNWVVEYHAHLMKGGEPYPWKDVPAHLRRITVDEALALQTFPHDFKLAGKKSDAYRMIGNAVPCNLAYAVASTMIELLKNPHAAEQKNMHSYQEDRQSDFLFEVA